ncbi:MBL fold metallo-hydrolase [Desulfosporosinus sp. PR]|uniref:MBL fold metallo-hydrolase n=1 Tax=Candidatus Desulfosporosinus nitrosoreducens TaxID=3401928 RepID=UPI0027EF9565|nr:MBL fold metallo-hydrolase [Desulfosporosinus sp. PR]MDQ7096426.1 MBL fold metallo-hydrolase [Desulfosporosinus sp. PR]
MNEEMFIQLLPKLLFISGEQGGRFPYSNGLLIEGNRRVLVDTGFGVSRREKILAGGRVDVIINTHFHLDHAYGNKYFPQAKIWVHTLDAPPIRSADQFMAYTGFSEPSDFPVPEHFPGGPSGREVDRELSDGEVLDFGDIALKVIHTPGHTRGHIALFEPQAGILFSGDIDLSSFGPWYGNVRSDLEEFVASINRLIDLNPKILVTSHAGIIGDHIPERLKRYAAMIDLRDEQILKHLQVPRGAADLLDRKIIFQRYPEPQKAYRFFEQTMLEKHLKRLVKQGKIVRKSDGKYKTCA